MTAISKQQVIFTEVLFTEALYLVEGHFIEILISETLLSNLRRNKILEISDEIVEPGSIKSAYS